MAPVPYPEVEEALVRLRAGVERILGENLLGLYVSGSLAGGDFDPASSDVDFVAAVWTPLEPTTVEQLRLMHEDLARSYPWGGRLEGAYIDREALRRHVAGERHPFINHDHPLGVTVLDDSWVLNRAQLREHGLSLCGPEPASLIDPVSAEQLKVAMRRELETWWQPMLRNSPRMLPRRYQAFAVLTMCRALYLFEYGRISSKQEAARWSISVQEPRWRSLIERALSWRADPTADPEALTETRAFIQFVLERSQSQSKAPTSSRRRGRKRP